VVLSAHAAVSAWMPPSTVFASQYQDPQRVFRMHNQESRAAPQVSSPVQGTASADAVVTSRQLFDLVHSGGPQKTITLRPTWTTSPAKLLLFIDPDRATAAPNPGRRLEEDAGSSRRRGPVRRERRSARAGPGRSAAPQGRSERRGSAGIEGGGRNAFAGTEVQDGPAAVVGALEALLPEVSGGGIRTVTRSRGGRHEASPRGRDKPPGYSTWQGHDPTDAYRTVESLTALSL
jgi:hypothetical protein